MRYITLLLMGEIDRSILIKLESDKDWEKFGSLLCLAEEEKRFIFLYKKVLGLEITGGEFLRMSQTERKELYDRVSSL